MIGKSIQATRKSKGLSQKVLAKRARITQPALSDIENGRSEPRDVTIIALARALGSNLGQPDLDKYLTEGDKLPSKQEVVKNMSVDEFVSLKFGGQQYKRSHRELEMLTKLLAAEIERVKREGY